MNKNETLYRDNPLEALTNQYFQLQRLQEEGKNVTPLLEEVWGQITDIIHGEDAVKLKNVRERIQNIIKEEVDHKEEGWCGPACLQWVARQEGIYYTQSQLARILGTTHENGTSHTQLLQGARNIGLQAFQMQGCDIEGVSELLPKHHIIVNWMNGKNEKDDGHYSILREVTKGMVYLNDRVMSIDQFHRQWYDIDEEKKIYNWALLIYKKSTNVQPSEGPIQGP